MVSLTNDLSTKLFEKIYDLEDDVFAGAMLGKFVVGRITHDENGSKFDKNKTVVIPTDAFVNFYDALLRAQHSYALVEEDEETADLWDKKVFVDDEKETAPTFKTILLSTKLHNLTAEFSQWNEINRFALVYYWHWQGDKRFMAKVDAGLCSPVCEQPWSPTKKSITLRRKQVDRLLEILGWLMMHTDGSSKNDFTKIYNLLDWASQNLELIFSWIDKHGIPRSSKTKNLFIEEIVNLMVKNRPEERLNLLDALNGRTDFIYALIYHRIKKSDPLNLSWGLHCFAMSDHI